MKSFLFWSWQQDRLNCRQRCGRLRPTRGLILRENGNLDTQVRPWLAKAVPQNLGLHRLAGQIQGQRGPHGETLCALRGSLRKGADKVDCLPSTCKICAEFSGNKNP